MVQTGELERPLFEIGDTGTDGFDLFDGVARLLHGFFAFSALAGGCRYIDAQAA
jgi:hypothetical protein